MQNYNFQSDSNPFSQSNGLPSFACSIVHESTLHLCWIIIATLQGLFNNFPGEGNGEMGLIYPNKIEYSEEFLHWLQADKRDKPIICRTSRLQFLILSRTHVILRSAVSHSLFSVNHSRWFCQKKFAANIRVYKYILSDRKDWILSSATVYWTCMIVRSMTVERMLTSNLRSRRDWRVRRRLRHY